MEAVHTIRKHRRKMRPFSLTQQKRLDEQASNAARRRFENAARAELLQTQVQETCVLPPFGTCLVRAWPKRYQYALCVAMERERMGCEFERAVESRCGQSRPSPVEWNRQRSQCVWGDCTEGERQLAVRRGLMQISRMKVRKMVHVVSCMLCTSSAYACCCRATPNF